MIRWTPFKTFSKHRRRIRGRAGLFFRGWLAVPVALFAFLSEQAEGQEIPRPSYARQKEKTSLPTISNFKIGEVLLRVDAHISAEFVDNVDLAATPKSDFILSPEVGISAIWAVTKLNTLRFRGALGYSYYFNSPLLNRQSTTISPDSALSFDLYAGDVRINFHNQFSLQQEAISQGSLSGVAQLERFTNTLGISILWDTNDVVWKLGYDHYTFITLNGANSSSGTVAAISNLDHSTDQVSGSAAVQLNTVLIGGIEATGAYSDYPKQPDSNFTGLAAGLFLEWQLSRYTSVFMSGGYRAYSSGANAPGSVSVNGSAAQPASGDPTGYYANVSLVHRLNRYYSDRLDIGHTDDVEALNGHTQTNFFRYAANWRINPRVTITGGLFFEDTSVVSGSALGGTVASDFRRFGATLSTGYRFSEHVDASLVYQYLKKEAERSSESYLQNRITISLGYRF